MRANDNIDSVKTCIAIKLYWKISEKNISKRKFTEALKLSH